MHKCPIIFTDLSWKKAKYRSATIPSCLSNLVSKLLEWLSKNTLDWGSTDMKDMAVGSCSLPGVTKDAFVGCLPYVEIGSNRTIRPIHRPFNTRKG